MTRVYHSGELAVQRLAGVAAQAARVGGIIRSAMPPVAIDFLERQQLAVIGSIDPHGRVWASLLTGPQGFMRADDDETVNIETHVLTRDDPLFDNLRHSPEVGIIAIEFASRRRMRLNGHAELRDDGAIRVQTKQVYSNCPRFIHAREIAAPRPVALKEPSVRRHTKLTEAQRRLITQADTFFIASFHPEGGADASHRGGEAGFLKFADGGTIFWPDYSGNYMFNTLGNIHDFPAAGLLFINFEEGHTLQLAGSAHVIWDLRRAQEFEGEERFVEFRVAEVIETLNATTLRWRSTESSPSDVSGPGCAA
jgi:uncharacterized protein